MKKEDRDENCHICNTITGNRYKITNAETYLVCSNNCLDILLKMKKILHIVNGLGKKYGKIMAANEVAEMLEGWFKPAQTKKYLKELTNRGFLERYKVGYIRILD